MSSDEIEAALDRVDTQEFLQRTFLCSGHGTVREILLDTAELKLLIRRAPEAVPPILRRLERAGGVGDEQTRIAYFLVVQESGDRRALPAVLRYLESLPDRERTWVESPWHPFNYAVDAARTLAGLDPAPGSIEDLFVHRRQIAAQARAALAHPPH